MVLIAPDIPIDPEQAFYPLRYDDKDNKIKPSYQYRECEKRILICLRWKTETIFFDDLTWFQAAGFGLKKLKLK